MAYTKDTLTADLKTLNPSGWDWKGKEPDKIRDEVLKENSDAKVGGIEEIAEYCWLAYSKAFSGDSDLIIGRVQHLEAAGLYAKVGEITGNETLFNDKTRGNLLKLDKWARVVNDSWIIGGVHRMGRYRLASPRIMENLWNRVDGFHVVTAREIIGLLHFGYEHQQVGPWQVMVCKGKDAAATASLIKYDEIMRARPTIESAIKLIDKEGSSARAAAQVQAFKSR